MELLEVYFQSKEETITFFDRIVRQRQKVELNWKASKEWGNQVKLQTYQGSEELYSDTANAMVEVFQSHRETNLIRQTVENVYYYRDHEEVQRIIELTQTLIKNKDPLFDEKGSLMDCRLTLLNLFRRSLRMEQPIHFDSVVKFCFQEYRNQLTEIIGLAIEEFKREEDYQSFIQSLREYIVNKKPKYKTVHVLQGDDFKFYKASGKPFSKMEVKMLVQQEPLYIVGLDESELNITPLLAMAPEQINIYGDHPSEPKTLTLINVFQEKAVFKPYLNFPFPNYLRNR